MYALKLMPRNLGLIKRILTEITPGQVFHQIRRNLTTNMYQDKDHPIIMPNSVYIDQTYDCNRRCKGCYVKGGKKIIPQELAEQVCDSSINMGFNYITWVGGEPLLPKVRGLVLGVSENFPTMSFTICTNGDFLDEEVADRIARVNHIVPFVSVDGLRDNHDWRRGNGSYDSTVRATDLLRDRGLMFGYITTLMPQNKDEVSSKRFVEIMIKRGALFGIYTLYSPWSREGRSLTSEEYTNVVRRLRSIATKMSVYILSSDFGNLASEIPEGSKRLIALSVGPTGEVKTERGGNPIGHIGPDGSLEDIVLRDETQKILRGKLNGTLNDERDARLKILQATSL